MRVNQKGYDPFWGSDPFANREKPKIEWEKVSRGVGTPEDNRKFFEGNPTTSTGDEPRKQINIKV